MSKEYRMGIYAAVSIMYMYRESIKHTKSVEEFREINSLVINRVFEEFLSTFNYELSYRQVSIAIYTWLAEGQKVENTEPFKYEDQF